MITTQDNNRGLVKVYWENISGRVAKIEPTFAKIVNELSPDKTFPLFLAYYPYGMEIGDTSSMFIPKVDGGVYRLSDSNVPKDVSKHLGYGIKSAPLSMVLDKEIEFFIDLKILGIAIPIRICPPGSFFAISRVINKEKNRIYVPNGILSVSSGARSVFMLPYIGCATNHANLQRDFNIQNPPPKSLHEHWSIFGNLVNNKLIECDWRSCVVYFSEKWIEKILHDKAWVHFKLYLHEIGLDFLEFQRSRIYYDIAFSNIQHKRNLKPNPYLADTARHLFATALGAAPGYIPATTNDCLPWEIIQNIYFQSYGLKKYYPSVMQPKHFSFEVDKQPVYYSLQHPSVQAFSPKSRKASSAIFEMRELRHIMGIFTEELSKPDGICADTVICKISKELNLKYFHNEEDQHQIMMPSTKIIDFDKRFNLITSCNNISEAKFASDAKFIRGCISISSSCS